MGSYERHSEKLLWILATYLIRKKLGFLGILHILQCLHLMTGGTFNRVRLQPEELTVTIINVYMSTVNMNVAYL